MALPTDDQGWITFLATCHDQERRHLKVYSDEYEMISPRSYMHPEILREVGERMAQVVIAWPQLVVDALEERLDVEGFRLPDEDEPDDDLWRIWQENCLDEQSQMGHVDALVMSRSYIAVGTNEEDADTPLVTFESPLEVYAHVDGRTRKPAAALRRWCDGDSYARETENYATLYLPNKTVYYELTGSKWGVVDQDDHNLGQVPIVPLVNRGRLANWRGRSELAPILPLAHAANKIATDMMVAAEFVAIPLRGMFGVGPQDFEDADGNKLTAMQAIMGRMLAIPDNEGKAKQFEFAASQLSNFHDTINSLARLVSSIAGIPAAFLGLATDNPPSADAIRASEARLVKRAERRQRAFGGAHEQAMRLVRRFQEGDFDPRLKQLETIWRDASTPTVAQKADAAVKLHAELIVPTRQTREDLGYTEAQISRMEQQDQLAAAQQSALFKLPTAAEQIIINDPAASAAAAVAGMPTPPTPAATPVAKPAASGAPASY